MGLLACFRHQASRKGEAEPAALPGRHNPVRSSGVGVVTAGGGGGEPHVTLLVMEAHWEIEGGERPYSFGDMLGAFFRQPQYAHVQLRHRRLKCAQDLDACAAEAGELSHPTVAVLSCHGEGGSLLLRAADAVAVAGRLRQAGGVGNFLSEIDRKYIITRRDVGRFLAAAPAVQLLHLGVCRSIQATGVRGAEPGAGSEYRVRDTARSLRSDLGLPPSQRVSVSGYTTYCDWSRSAVAEFHYYALLLDRRLDTYVGRSKGSVAADALLRDIRFSGYDAKAPPGSEGLGFCCFDL